MYLIGILLIPHFSYAESGCPAWPRSDYFVFSPNELNTKKQSLLDWSLLMVNSGRMDLLSILPGNFFVYPLDKASEWQSEIDALIKQMIQQSPLAKELIYKTQFSAKQITLIFTKEAETPIESWSNQSRLETYIFMTADRCNRTRLLSILAHEIAVRADSKALSYRQLLEKYRGDSNEDMMMTSLLLDPDLYLSFLTLRAFQIERDILRDMGIKPKETGISSGDCISDLKKILSLQVQFSRTTPIGVFYNIIGDHQHMAWALSKVSLRNDLSEQQKNLILTLILDRRAQFEFMMKTKIYSQNFCDFFAQPDLKGPFPTLMSMGPRPSIGSGTGVTKLQAESFSRPYLEKLKNYRIVNKDIRNRGYDVFDFEDPNVLFESLNRENQIKLIPGLKNSSDLGAQ